MIIQQFSAQTIRSTVFKTYIATGFFATLIFFVLNSHIFTPYEMMLGTIVATIAFKGLSNIMVSMVILLFDLQDTHEQQQFKIAEDKLDLLIHQMNLTEAGTTNSSIKEKGQ